MQSDTNREFRAQPIAVKLTQLDALAVFEAAPAPYLVLTPDFIIAAASNSYLQATSTIRKEMIGRSLFEIFPEQPNGQDAGTVSNLKTSLERVLSTGQPDRMTIQKYDLPKQGIPGGDLEERYWSPLNTPVFDKSGTLTHILHHVEDVTDTTRARLHATELEESEARFRQIANALPQIVWTARPDGFVDWYNDWWYEYTGTRRGSNWDDQDSPMHPDDIQPTWERWRRSLATGDSYEMEYRFRRKSDGEYRWHLGRAVPVKDDSGHIVKWIGSNTDVDDQRRTEASLKSSQEELKLQLAELNTLIESAPEAIYMGTENGINRCNQRALEMLGFNTLEQLNQNIASLSEIVQNRDPITKQTLSPEELPFVKALKGEHSVRDTEVIHLKTGERRVIRGAASPVRVGDQVVAAVAVNTDVTEERARERKLHETLDLLQKERELRERFVATLSHDLRTPLTAAKISAQLMLRKSDDPAIIRTLGPRMVNNIDRADQMIQDLLDANRIKAGEKLPLEISHCNLNQIVSDALEELSTIYGDRFVLHADSTAEGYWSCSGLRRILENLCSNAIKYGLPHRPITVSLLPGPERVEIRVHNEGPPIPHAEQSNLFEAFTRLESAQTGEQKGWGLGLTLVRGIAEAHGGQVNLESSDERTGTTFSVELPLDARKTRNA